MYIYICVWRMACVASKLLCNLGSMWLLHADCRGLMPSTWLVYAVSMRSLVPIFHVCPLLWCNNRDECAKQRCKTRSGLVQDRNIVARHVRHWCKT